MNALTKLRSALDAEDRRRARRQARIDAADHRPGAAERALARATVSLRVVDARALLERLEEAERITQAWVDCDACAGVSEDHHHTCNVDQARAFLANGGES